MMDELSKIEGYISNDNESVSKVHAKKLIQMIRRELRLNDYVIENFRCLFMNVCQIELSYDQAREVLYYFGMNFGLHLTETKPKKKKSSLAKKGKP